MKVEKTVGVFVIEDKFLYCRTPYGKFPVPKSLLKIDYRELADASVEVEVKGGVVISYKFVEE